jgi:hypothetical protein
VIAANLFVSSAAPGNLGAAFFVAIAFGKRAVPEPHFDLSVIFLSP